MKKKTCLIIYNPRSGKGKVKEKIDIYEKILKENGYTVDIVGTKGICVTVYAFLPGSERKSILMVRKESEMSKHTQDTTHMQIVEHGCECY